MSPPGNPAFKMTQAQRTALMAIYHGTSGSMTTQGHLLVQGEHFHPATVLRLVGRKLVAGDGSGRIVITDAGRARIVDQSW